MPFISRAERGAVATSLGRGIGMVACLLAKEGVDRGGRAGGSDLSERVKELAVVMMAASEEEWLAWGIRQ